MKNISILISRKKRKNSSFWRNFSSNCLNSLYIILKWISNYIIWFRTLHPMSSNSFGHGVDHSHAVIIKLPKMSALEKVSFSVNILEGSVNIWGNATPHWNIARIIEFYSTDWIIKSPILVAYKKKNSWKSISRNFSWKSFSRIF